MDLPDTQPEPPPDEMALTPVQRRARRRRVSRRAMTLVTWSLVLASGLLIIQRQQAQGASSRPGAPREVLRHVGPATDLGPNLRTEQAVHAPARPVVARDDLPVDTACGLSGMGGCAMVEKGVPLKASSAMPAAEALALDPPPVAPAPIAPVADIKPLRIDVAGQPAPPAVTEECRQVAEEIQSIAAALRDVVDAGLREQLQRRGREADNRQFFLHCLS